MEKIIQALYTMQLEGRLEEFAKPYEEKKEAAFQGYMALKEKLGEELAQELENMMNAQMEALTLELEESFAEGFKTGVKLMYEVFGKEEDK